MKTPVSVLFTFFLAAALPAQAPLQLTPVFRNYTTDQGLPNNWVYDIYQDKTGYIWIATNHGVCRFNGYEFEQFPDTLYANLTAVLTGGMMEDEHGRMWFTDYLGRVFYMDKDTVRPYATAVIPDEIRAKASVFTTIIPPDGEKPCRIFAKYGPAWDITESGCTLAADIPPGADYLVLEQGKRHAAIQYPNASIEDTKAFHRTLAFQDGSGRYRRCTLPLPRGDKSDMVLIGKLRDGHWLLHHDRYLYAVRDGVLQWFIPYERSPLYAWEDPDGALLVGHVRTGLLRYRSLYDLRAGKPDQELFNGMTVSVILRDREGGYWIGTQEAGVFYAPSWQTGAVARAALLMGKNIQGLATDGGQRLYAAAADGEVFEVHLARSTVRKLPPSQIEYLSDLTFQPSSATLAAAGRPPKLWNGSRWDFLSIQRAHGWERLFFCKNLWPAAQPGQWLYSGTNNVGIASGSRDHPLDQSDPYHPATRYVSIFQSPDRRIWISGTNGLREWLGGDRFSPPPLQHPAFLQPFANMDTRSDGSLVFGAKGHGVVIWKPGTEAVTEIRQQDGLLSDKVYYVHAAADGVIWACTPQGLSRLTPTGQSRYRVDNFTVKHGLPSNTVHKVLSLANGDLWVATAKGLFRLQQKPGQMPMPPPRFEKVLVNGAPYTAGQISALPHDSAAVSIEFLSLHYRSSGDIPYRFRLLAPGSDTQWTRTRDRIVYFSNLRPGTYRFEVQAQDEEAQWSAYSALSFTIRPPWWATWWARGAGLALVGLLTFAIYRYRIHQLNTESRLQAEMYRLERAALQAQMNPHFIFNCLNSIQHFILTNDPDAAVLYLAKFAKLVRGALKASVNGQVSLAEEIKMLDNYLALEQLRFKKAFQYDIRTEGISDPGALVLPPLLIQPFVENAVLHGMKDKKEGGRIAIRFVKEPAGLLIEVTDNGDGLPPEIKAGSLGGKITVRRLELLQQQAEQKSIAVEYGTPPEGRGTTVRMRVPLQ